MAARWLYEMADGSLSIGYTRFAMLAFSALPAPLISRGFGLGPMKRLRRWHRNQALPAKRQVRAAQGSTDEVSTH
jgi:hypothetical protein